MNEYTSIFLSTFFNEVYCIVENTFDILDSMIFKMVFLVLECVFMIVLTNITTTVNDMSDFIV